MLSNYLKIALRSLMAHRLYSTINILGLAIGLASCILMFLFVKYELSYDTQFEKSDRVARMQMHQISSAGNDEWPRTGAGWKELVKSNYPEVIEGARITLFRTQLKVGETSISEQVGYADKEIFKIFNFEFVAGSADTAFNDIRSTVLTESTARNLFGDENPIGQSVSFFQTFDMKVTGVIKDFPENSHFTNMSFANLLAAAEYVGDPNYLTNMTNMNFYTYFEFADSANIEKVEAQLSDLIDKNLGAMLKQVNVKLWSSLVPVSDIHLHSRMAGDYKAPGDINQVYLFTAIALLMLAIACINFMNLATARASQRAKEVGVRKAIGVNRSQIIVQFLSESIIICGIALLIAVAFVEVSLPVFAEFVNRELEFNYLANPQLLVSLIGLAILVGVLAGSYPAFYLSAFSAAKVLKGDVTRGKQGTRFRQSLVIFQFCIASVLIISTMITYQQMQFTKNMKLGFDKSQVMIVNSVRNPTVAPRYESFVKEMGDVDGVQWISSARRMPSGRLTNNMAVRKSGQENVIMPYNAVDFDFFKNFGVELVAGRHFSKEFAQDTFSFPDENTDETYSNVIINQQAAKKFGWDAEAAIGKTLEFQANSEGNKKVIATVVGVVKDYHFESARELLKPIIHMVSPSQNYEAAIKIDTQDIAGTISKIESVWRELFPDVDFRYQFMDDSFAALYADEERIADAYTVFSVLAIIIACLGLFGLAAFTTERRTKEIGVRKVLGASGFSIIMLLSTEFSKLVIVASIFAWPLSWLIMNEWLQNFAFRVELSVLVFIFGTILALAIAWITVVGQASKAALTRPVNALRYE